MIWRGKLLSAHLVLIDFHSENMECTYRHVSARPRPDLQGDASTRPRSGDLDDASEGPRPGNLEDASGPVHSGDASAVPRQDHQCDTSTRPRPDHQGVGSSRPRPDHKSDDFTRSTHNHQGDREEVGAALLKHMENNCTAPEFSDKSQEYEPAPNSMTDIACASRVDINKIETVGSRNSCRRNLQNLTSSLSIQERMFETEQEVVEKKKASTKERVRNLFSDLRDVLLRKETELLEKIDAEFSAGNLEQFVQNIKNEKSKVERILENPDLSEDTSELENDINASLRMRDSALDRLMLCNSPCLSLNEEVISTIQNLSVGDFQEIPEEVCDEDTDVQQIENTAAVSEETSNEEITDAIYTDELGEDTQGAEARDVEDVRETNRAELELPETCVRETVTMPSAPPLQDNDSPPPYWQAIGLNHPEDELEQWQSQAQTPGYHEILQSDSFMQANKLEYLHSFPIQTKQDCYRKIPAPVALNWNFGRICVADRANMNVKFFSPHGVLTSMYFVGKELQDACFLEQTNGEARYMLVCGSRKENAKCLLIGINNQEYVNCVKNMNIRQVYSAICHGPREQTLVGTNFEPRTNRLPEIHLLTLNMDILMSITQPLGFMRFAYPRAVEVFERHIIVLDWKLGTVCVFLEDGTPKGEYKGIPGYPLSKPSDMTLDHAGYILILNGEFPNIHVIDLQCNCIQVIKTSRREFPGSRDIKLIAFDSDTRKVALASNSEVAIFSFRNDYIGIPPIHRPPVHVEPACPPTLPFIEGMLPSTVESMIARQPALPVLEGMLPGNSSVYIRRRTRQFHL